MPTTRSRAPLLIAIAALSLPLVAHAKFKDAGDGNIRFTAKGPAGMNIEGSAEDFKAEENNGKLVLKVSAKTLKTGIGLRNKHLRGYLEADKCPDIKYEVERSKLKLPANNQRVTGDVIGSFTLHCVSKPMKFTYTAKRTGSDYHVQAFPANSTKTLDIRDHSVEVPCYLGVCVDPKIKLDVRFKLRDVP